VSTFQRSERTALEITDASIEQIRSMLGGGQLAPPPTSQTRWYLQDLERAVVSADVGEMSRPARLWSAMRSDGVIWGLRNTLSSGVVRLPKRYYSTDQELLADLRPQNGTPSAFDDMCPPAEQALMVDDACGLGVAVGELTPVEGRDIPRLTRLEPEFLFYRWTSNRWYYRSVAGLIEITPGDGRWVLHLPGGIVNPWRNGLYRAVGRSYINKDHSLNHRSNYSSKLANAARVVTAPPGATEEQRTGFLSRIAAWGINSVFELPVGWQAALLESNGRGYDVFKDEIATSDQESMIAIAGQIVTTTGGTGFTNMDLFQAIRHDIIETVGQAWAHTLNTQVLPAYSLIKRGQAWQEHRVIVELVTRAPKDHVREATTMVTVGNGIAQMNAALAASGRKVEEDELLTRFDIPWRVMTPEEKAAHAASLAAGQKPTTPATSAQALEADAEPRTAGEPGTSKQDQRERSDAEDDSND
jgi:hypothetical protein